MAVIELQKKLSDLLKEGEEIAGKNDLSREDQARLETIYAEGTEIKSKLEVLAKAEGLSDWARKSTGFPTLATPTGGFVGARQAGQATVEDKGNSLLVNDEGEMLIDPHIFKTLTDPEYGKAFKAYLRKGDRGVKAEELKVLQEGSDVAGGYLVPEDILARLVSKEPAPSTVASRVSRLTTGRDALTIPKVTYTTDNQYTSGMRITWTGEIPASATVHRVTDPVFGQVRIPIYTAMMSLPLTNDMVEDANFPIIDWCTGKFQETLELLYEDMILNGTGAARPEGITVNTDISTVASGAATALTWDGVKNLLYDLPEQYDRNAVVVMNKTNTAKELAGLLDGNGRPYWSEGLQDSGLAGQRINRPLMGYPVVFNAFMPNSGTASNKPIIFGDLAAFYLVNRIGFSIQVLRELYAETNQVLLLGRVRFGGRTVEDWRLRLQNISA